jgi:hypothetical protein
MIKNVWFLFTLWCLGCSSSNQDLSYLDLPIPPRPPTLFPSTPPPSFIPSIYEVKDIQINRIPHPLNVDGNLPYVVWVDGKRLPLNSNEVKLLAKSLGLKFEQPKDTARIHSGDGWMRPFPVPKKDAKQNLSNREYGQEKATP